MAVGDNQRLMISILEEILNEKAVTDISFDWLKNKHIKEDFENYWGVIEEIFRALNGNKLGMNSKGSRKLKPDCYFGGKYNFIFEFDELQHFTIYKKKTLSLYPESLTYGFNLSQYIKYCDKYSNEAIKKGPAGYRKPKDEFPFENGRAAQRAFFDAFRDILPTLHGLNPTVRISEFEVSGLLTNSAEAHEKIKNLLKMRKII